MRLAAVLGAPSRNPSPSLAPVHSEEKVIVFSQWTSMLDLIEIALKREKYVHSRDALVYQSAACTLLALIL